jgi:hypothetical protein
VQLWLIALLLTLGPLTAAAEQSLTAVLFHTGAGTPREVDRAKVRRAMETRKRFKGRTLHWMRSTELRDLLGKRRRAELLRRARAEVKRGAALLGRLELKRAVRMLRSGLKRFAALQPDLVACQEVVTPLRDLAFAHWQRKDLARAAALVAGAAQAPPTPIDTVRYPPAFVAFLRRAHTVPSIGVKPPKLPSKTVVWRMCKRLDPAAPFEVNGSAIMRVSAHGYRDWAGVIVSSDPGTVVLAQLEPEGPLWKTSASTLREVGVEVLVLWRRSPAGVLEARIPPEAWRPLPPPAPVVVAVNPKKYDPDEREPPTVVASGSIWTRSTARWTLAGVGAAALLTGSVLGLVARDAANKINDAAEDGGTFDDHLQDLDSRRRRTGTAAYVLWGVGAAAAAGALVWWLLDRDRPREARSVSLVAPLRRAAGLRPFLPRAVRLGVGSVSYLW